MRHTKTLYLHSGCSFLRFSSFLPDVHPSPRHIWVCSYFYCSLFFFSPLWTLLIPSCVLQKVLNCFLHEILTATDAATSPVKNRTQEFTAYQDAEKHNQLCPHKVFCMPGDGTVSSRVFAAYLLGLLAMIKCSICSYQCDN